jgi:hypothetical protein
LQTNQQTIIMKNVLNAVTVILVILFFGWQFYVTSCKEECVPNESGSEVTETVIECSETDDSIELDVDTTQIDSVTQEEQLINQILDTMNTDTVIIQG